MNYYKNDTITITDKTWAEYAATKDVSLRNQILLAYLYIVTCSIKKMNTITVNNEDIEDMTSHGVLELINCIDRFDYTRGIQFDTFASIRVRGSIIDYIRKKDWVPRDVRKRIKVTNDAALFLQNNLGRAPNEKELAEHLNFTEDELNKIRRDELSLNILAFEDLLQENNSCLINAKSTATYQHPEEKILEDEFKKSIIKCIDELDSNERTVISLYYYEELKLKEIAFVMELTTSRISQIHSKALSKMKSRLSAYITG
ncbi:MAG: hypothetical protein A2Y15_04820 [Clostridiales bacterium GWF2_36_10]|nr:MAG: hypothetical protein A2Y15_04820 [Clostridiales bacterium GWF2_36_10]HAN20843.1 FliA/WhiG family RNA polymerase sigma factor [Clostridiales bacterium]